MSDKEKVQMLSGSFSAEELATLIQTMADSNREALKDFARELASRITHPEPRPEEIARRQTNLKAHQDRCEQEAADKARKRASCTHRRVGAQWGMFNGSSVIAWAFPTYTYRDTDGIRRETEPQPFGVCQWCGSEFKSGDPDFAEALSWGTNAVSSIVQMNVRTGTWN